MSLIKKGPPSGDFLSIHIDLQKSLLLDLTAGRDLAELAHIPRVVGIGTDFDLIFFALVFKDGVSAFQIRAHA